MKYTEKVINIVKNARYKMKEIDEQINAANAELSAKRIKNRNSTYPPEDTYQLEEKIKELSEKKFYTGNTAEDKLRSIYSEYIEKIQNFSGDMLHEDSKLLSLDGIVLSYKQFSNLVEKHKENPLMIQLLSNYNEKHAIQYNGVLPTIEQKKNDFNSFIDEATAIVNLNREDFLAGNFMRGDYTPESVFEDVE